MAFDQVKTQVLILHSEQSALDNLSQGFDDRYTVHCATSGTEALNIFGDTPIHVIISAKDLPGMSGVETLREAKKRSPETIGILLAGPEDKNLEALVGDKEVFQIVRGGINGDDLGKLIDNATRQMRLMALAESANDTAANPDEPVTEHIVMETSEHGSTIISDGTGTMPVLDPKKVSASAAAGAGTIDVLVLTKDEEFLATVKESTRGMHNVRYANTLAQAEEALAKKNIGVAVVDAAMVGPNVEKLTQHLRKKTNRLVNIVAGRRDDGEMLMDLINRGKVYRFLLKPVSPGRARLAIEASVKHHLEAPDSAFKTTGKAPAKPAPASPVETTQAPPKPAPKPELKAAPETSPKPAPKPAPEPAPVAKKEPPPVPPAAEADASPMDDALSSAFEEEKSGFAATMTGIVETVGKTFSKDEDTGSALEESAMDVGTPLGVRDTSGESSFMNPKIIGAGALAIVAVAALGFWMFSGSDEETPVVVEEAQPEAEGSVAEDEFVAEEPPVVESTSGTAVEDLLDEASLAANAGQIFSPPGNNALELYAAALAAAPDSEAAVTGFDATLQQTLGMAETALLERRVVDAGAALDSVALVDPDNARLPFLAAQFEQVQLRDALDTARAAIRENRFEDAANAVATAEALNPADVSEIDAVSAELAAARSAQQVDDVLAQASTRLEQGNLISPANDNARYYYQLVLSNDPGNSAAQQGLIVIASKLVLQARTEIDQNRFDRAEGLLAQARRLDPSSAELASAATALTDAKERVAAEQRAAAQRAEQQRLAAERAEAERLAAEQAEAERIAAAQEAERIAAEQRAEQERLAAEAAAAATVSQTIDSSSAGGNTATTSSSGVAADDPATAGAGATDTDVRPPVMAAQQSEPAAPIPVSEQTPVGISSLSRTRYVAPKYPRSAERRSLSGWVDVVFTVAMDGTTKDIEIRDAEPTDIFDSAAVKAVERWEFEPVIENGVLVEKRAGVRMMFAIE